MPTLLHLLRQASMRRRIIANISKDRATKIPKEGGTKAAGTRELRTKPKLQAKKWPHSRLRGANGLVLPITFDTAAFRVALLVISLSLTGISLRYFWSGTSFLFINTVVKSLTLGLTQIFGRDM